VGAAEGVGDKSSVGFSVSVFIAMGISIGVTVGIVAEVDADSGVGKPNTSLGLQALIPKSKIIENIPILFIFSQSFVSIPTGWFNSGAKRHPL
jgi:hypothetical protein